MAIWNTKVQGGIFISILDDLINFNVFTKSFLIDIIYSHTGIVQYIT